MSERLAPESCGRRDLLSWAAVGTAGVAILGTVAGMLRLVKPRVLPEAASRFSIGDPGDFTAGEERVITERNVIILSATEGIAAISLVCTHLGCIVARSAEGFSCPCHGSRFGEQGKVLGGPAPRGLPWLEISRRPDGKLLVDLKREVSPGTFYVV